MKSNYCFSFLAECGTFSHLLLFVVIRGSLGIEDLTGFDLGDDSVAMTGPADLVSGLWDNNLGAEMPLHNNSPFSPFGEDESNQNLLFAADSLIFD